VLGVLLHALRGPFYSPKAARSRLNSIWKVTVAFCSWAHWTVWWHTGQSGAAWGPLATSIRRSLIALPTVGVGPTGSPDSKVHT
jgi:hypothetical protein